MENELAYLIVALQAGTFAGAFAGYRHLAKGLADLRVQAGRQEEHFDQRMLRLQERFDGVEQRLAGVEQRLDALERGAGANP